MGFLRDQFGNLVLDDNGRPQADELLDGVLVYPDAQPRTSRSTTTLEAGLYHYLADSQPYAGHAQRPFRRVLTIDGITLRDRNDARRELLSRVGRRIYLDRRPADAEDDLSIVLRWTNATHEYGLAGEAEGTESYLVATVYATGHDAVRRGGTVYGLLQACVSGYHQGYWGDVLIGECTVDTGRTLAYAPSDASDQWTFTRQMNLAVYHYGATTPEYSAWPLNALPAIQVNSTQLRCSFHQSLVAENIPLINAAWIVRATDGGNEIMSFGGDPSQAVDVPGVSGTNANPIIDRTVYTTIPSDPFVTLILTDMTGEQSSKGVTING